MEGVPLSSIAARRGVPLDTLGRSLWHAARALEGLPPVPMAPLAGARHLLEEGALASPTSAEGRALAALRAQAEPLRALAAQRRMRLAPYEPWLRGAAALALVALALWMS